MGELAVIDGGGAVSPFRASTDAATLCKEIVTKTAARIQGKRYVTVEGWQAIAIAHGCAASADHVERVADEGASGFKAMGIIRRMSDGVEIARAEGFLGDDEGMWAKRPVYARRAMAQTRAISRACRSAFAHVVVMMDAGLMTTPAEEIPHDPETGEIVEHPRLSSGPAPRTKLEGPHTAKTKLRNAVNAIISKVRTASTNDEIDAIQRENIETIRQANRDWPELLTGEPGIEEDVGLRGVVERRRAELATAEPTPFDMLLEHMSNCDTKTALDNFMITNETFIADLDGEESRRFQMAYDAREAAIQAMDQVTAGA